MKAVRLSPRASRVAAIGLLVLVAALAYRVLLHGWFVAPLRAIAAQMDELRDTRSRYAAAIAEKPQLLKRIAAQGVGDADSRAFLPEDDPGSAAADLMRHVVDAVAAQRGGGACVVMQKMPVTDLPARAGEPYRAVAVNVSLRCDIQPLVGVLQALRQGTPSLFADSIGIYRNPVAGQPGGEQPSLDVQLALSGYLRPATAASSAPVANGGVRAMRMPGGTP